MKYVKKEVDYCIESMQFVILQCGTGINMGDKNRNILQQSEKKTGINTVFTVILITVIIILELIGGGILYQAHVKEKNCSAIVEGTLVKWNRRTKEKGVSYSPIVEYNVGNEIYTGISNVWGNILPIKKGDKVIIGYNPSNPTEFYMEGYDLNNIRITGSIFIIIGAALALVNMICFVLNRINMDKKKRMRIEVIICASGILLVFYWMMLLIMGVGITLLISLILGFFIFYVKHKNRSKKQDDSIS